MGSPVSGYNRVRDEDPQHQVTISKPFYLGVTEVTQAQLKAVMATEPWKGRPFAKEGGENAASYVSWDDAAAFCRKLSQKSGRALRLPTEAEWEYACRAGSKTKYCFGDDDSKLGGYAWYNKNAWNVGEQYAHRVGQKKANTWGLYDMHGNVLEWCQDWYGAYPSSATTDPVGPPSGSYRAVRGGSWFNDARYCRSAVRSYYSPELRNAATGFRLARTQ